MIEVTLYYGITLYITNNSSMYIGIRLRKKGYTSKGGGNTQHVIQVGFV